MSGAVMPATPPAAGQQYAFDVDLDACSGCKSCVAACHALNGLEEEESWRDVGLLHGGSQRLPAPPDLLENLVGRLRPDQGAGMLVVGLEAILEVPLQIRHRMEDAAAKRLLGPRAEESLDQIQPRRTGRRKVPGDALLPLDPVQDLGVLVGRVVI